MLNVYNPWRALCLYLSDKAHCFLFNIVIVCHDVVWDLGSCSTSAVVFCWGRKVRGKGWGMTLVERSHGLTSLKMGKNGRRARVCVCVGGERVIKDVQFLKDFSLWGDFYFPPECFTSKKKKCSDVKRNGVLTGKEKVFWRVWVFLPAQSADRSSVTFDTSAFSRNAARWP